MNIILLSTILIFGAVIAIAVGVFVTVLSALD